MWENSPLERVTFLTVLVVVMVLVRGWVQDMSF